jgi:hypothetical protein
MLTGPGVPPASQSLTSGPRLDTFTSLLLPNTQTAPPSQQSSIEPWNGLPSVLTEGQSTNERRVFSYQRNAAPSAATSTSFGSITVRTGASAKRSRSTRSRHPLNHPLLSLPSYTQATDVSIEDVLVCLLPYAVLAHSYDFIPLT